MLVNGNAFIIDVQEFDLNKTHRERLLDNVEYLMCHTSSLVKKAEFDINDFANTKKDIKNYTIIMERLLREPKLEQWRVTFIKDNKVKMVAIGQVER